MLVIRVLTQGNSLAVFLPELVTTGSCPWGKEAITRAARHPSVRAIAPSLRHSRATATFAWLGSAEMGIIHFDQSGQLVIGIPLRHGLANLVAHNPPGFVSAVLQYPLEKRREAPLFAAPSERSSRTISSGASGFKEKWCRPSAKSGNHRPCMHINRATDESTLGRVDNEDTDNPAAIATQTDVSDQLLQSEISFAMPRGSGFLVVIYLLYLANYFN